MWHGQHNQAIVVAVLSFVQKSLNLDCGGNRLAQLIPTFNQTEFKQLPYIVIDHRQHVVVQLDGHGHRITVDIFRSWKAKHLRSWYGRCIFGMQP